MNASKLVGFEAFCQTVERSSDVIPNAARNLKSIAGVRFFDSSAVSE
jgi:hypothetical protein